MKNQKKSSFVWKVVIIIVALTWILNKMDNLGIFNHDNYDNNDRYSYDDKTFSIVASSDNKVLDESLKNYAKKKGYDIRIDYKDTLDIIDELNSGKKYDSILVSNSMWLSMLDSSVVKTSSLRSTSITPVIFGIKASKAKELGFVGKSVKTSDILKQIENGKLKFSMANPVTTNSGVSAYLEILTNLSGNPEVLKSSHLKDSKLKSELKKFFKGIKRTSGDEAFLETSFINGDYDAAFTYESSIININKTLAKEKKETLYAIYPIDGVAISDSPFVYIDNKNDNKKEIFNDIQSYLLSNDGQKVLLNSGRRTWYGGVNKNAPKDVFNPKWGINTTEYITPIKYPSIAVIKEALELYQTEFRKPVHVVFCLDYSGSMYGDGIKELREAMKEVLLSNNSTIKFSDKDKITIVPFEYSIIDVWSTTDGYSKEKLLELINETDIGSSTALYPATIKALEILSKENTDDYVTSVILMTDGMANVGRYSDLEKYYKKIKKEIPVYSIMFGSADEDELLEISNLTNGRVFNGKYDLTAAFKKVRGYN